VLLVFFESTYGELLFPWFHTFRAAGIKAKAAASTVVNSDGDLMR